MKCPIWSKREANKIGKTEAGSQRFRCFVCQHKYTPKQKARGYDFALCRQAVRLYVDGMNLRRIGRHLDVTHRTVARRDIVFKLPIFLA